MISALTRAWREFGPSAKITLHLTSGVKLTGQITQDSVPTTWPLGEIVICESHRNGTTSTHSVPARCVLAVTVTV